VHGAGGAVGTATLQLGKLLGLEMFGTASRPKHELLSALNATPIDYQREKTASQGCDSGP
jgi:NADPH2:quinone reductase